ncbi:MAG: glycosyltransferase family 2 protein [Bryobacterales bacterium]|nr:glycosyltransferase family 2 protein [Bryobacterales bacterium]
MHRTGVVVVTYNSSSWIERCLKSCGDLPVIVVDNASRDNTCELVRRSGTARLIANPSNYGFGHAVNQGVAALDTELILLLNPDAEIKTPLEEMETACLAEGTGLAAGKLIDEHGDAQRGFTLRRFPKPVTLVLEVLGMNRLLAINPLNRSYRCLDVDLSESFEAEQPAGAFLMFRRKVWQRLGGFDTQFYPLWFEDVDFCKRARDLGLKIQYVPQVTALHQGGHSIAGVNWQCREIYWYASLLKYASKHFSSHAFRWVSAAVVLGSVFRSAAGVVTRRSLEPIRVYTEVSRLAGGGVISGHAGELKIHGGRATPAIKS